MLVRRLHSKKYPTHVKKNHPKINIRIEAGVFVKALSKKKEINLPLYAGGGGLYYFFVCVCVCVFLQHLNVYVRVACLFVLVIFARYRSR